MALYPVSAPRIFAARHGLLETGNLVDRGSQRWNDGVTFTNRGCEVVFAHDLECWIAGTNDKAVQECGGLAEFAAYDLEVTLGWSMADMAADPKALVQEAIDVGASSVLERLVEQGVADTATIAVPGVQAAITVGGVVGHGATGAIVAPTLELTAVDLGSFDSMTAMAAVEAKMLDSGDHVGGGGVVYMNPVVAAPQASSGLLIERDGHLESLLTGNRVVIGNFEHASVYGHNGDVDVYLGAVSVTEGWDRLKNQHVVQAEVSAVAAWNTCATFKADVAAPTP